jgi:hypothetical protein
VHPGDVIEQADGKVLVGLHLHDAVAVISVKRPQTRSLSLHGGHISHAEKVTSTLSSFGFYFQGTPWSSGSYVCLRILRDSAARITVRILRSDKMEMVASPQVVHVNMLT